MLELLKLLGKGLLTILMSPFIAIAFVLYCVYAIVFHVLSEIKAVLTFFSGKKPYGDDEEMKLLKEYREKLLEKNNPFASSKGGNE